ncbi:MAG: DUF2079 domain-containing protein [Deltaproteobacteria bacterium]|nr:MAG: DUF2079 domain-containing protein [Deltaproteobacteria bacterium]
MVGPGGRRPPGGEPPVKHPPRRRATWIAAALVGVAMLLFVGTALSTSFARLAVLRTVEPYAWAVQEQLAYNFGTRGVWKQVIHSGYDDAWTWSGHRAGTLVVVAWLYALAPSAKWMSALMVGGIALGAIPAALIGRRALRSPWGLLLGGLVYLGAPAVMATALQDYQDLCFATPALMFTLWSMQARRPAWALLGAAVGVLPREECVPLVVACALVTLWPPAWRGARWKRWLLNVGAAGLVAGAWAGWLQWAYPVSTQPGQGHDTPLVNAMRTVLSIDGLERLPGLSAVSGFYDLTWAPLGLLGLLSPWTALPGVLLILMHMTVPPGHGVDRAWSGHAHHLAPVLPFLLAATIQGAGRLLRMVQRLRPAAAPWLGRGLAAGLAVGGLAYGAWWVRAWGDSFHLVWSAWPRSPAYEHPVWTLVRALPPDAVPVVSVQHAIAVSNRPVSFTYEESLDDKARFQGLALATHMIVHEQVTRAVDRAMAMPGAHVIDRLDGYLLIGWNPGSPDPAAGQGGGGQGGGGQGGGGQGGVDPAVGGTPRYRRPPDWIPPGYRQETIPGVPPFGR